MSANQENPTLKRLEEQIDWYDKKSAFNQSCFRRLKIIELVTAVLIPLLAGFSTLIPFPAIITGGLGAMIVVFESLQGLYQFQSNWISGRVCGLLKNANNGLGMQSTRIYADSI